MSDKATPRPWYALRRGVYREAEGLDMLHRIAHTDARAGRGSRERAEADARMIVSAVNAYEAHQRAAEALRKLMEKHPHSGACCTYDARGGVIVTPQSCKCGSKEKEARAALAELDKVVQP